MLISFFNPSDLIGCGGDINQSDSFRYTEGYAEGVCRGVRGGGTWRGTRRGYAEGVRGGVRGGVSLQLIRLCGGVSLQLGCVEGCHSN